MTRINIIPPQLLTDNHLIAEIKEINQLAGQFRKSANSKNGIHGIPPTYRLNGGHVKFFYPRGKYLHKRFDELKREAISRNFNIVVNFKNEWENFSKYYNDWSPTNSDVKILTQRITEKIKMKPHIYRYRKEKINVEQYLIMLNTYKIC